MSYRTSSRNDDLDVDLEYDRDGTARFATEREIEAAGHFEPGGEPIGYAFGRLLWLKGDKPRLIIKGSGGGKTTGQLAYVTCLSNRPMLILDPKTELAQLSEPSTAGANIRVWPFNPYRKGHGRVASLRVNPLDILKLSSPTFHPDTHRIVAAIIQVSGAANSKYFEVRGQGWASGIMKCDVEVNGFTSFPSLYRIINTVESDPERWQAFLANMEKSRFADVRRTAGEMRTKQENGGNEFGSIMGELYGGLKPLDDPELLASLENPDFSLSVLTETDTTNRVMINVDGKLLSELAPVIRTMIETTTLYRARSPGSPQILFVADEAAQMGSEGGGSSGVIMNSFVFSRGEGVTIMALYQDTGQPQRQFGPTGFQSLMSSSELRAFGSFRDGNMTKMVSDMLGFTTVRFDDTLRQNEARHRKQQVLRRIMDGEDALALRDDYAQLARASANKSVHKRLLRTPDELMVMPDDQMIAFITGLRPILLHTPPYFTRSEMAGRYVSTTLYPPLDRVMITTRWRGQHWARVIEEPVPAEFSHLPQYQTPSGLWRYADGFRPRIERKR